MASFFPFLWRMRVSQQQNSQHFLERFYWIESPQVGMQRGWVGHQREHKWFTVVAGEVQVAVVKPDDWQSPSADLPVARYVLYAARPQVLS